MSIKAKFFCNAAHRRAETWSNGQLGNEHVELSVVQGATPDDKIFQAASPGGEVKLQIASPAAMGFFEPGKKYYVTFEEAPEGA